MVFMRFRTEFVVAVLVLAAAPAGAERITYCCNDENGRQTCSDVLPPQCYGRAYREINSQGITLRRVEAPLTPEQRVQREQETRRKREQERLAAEERRQAQALLDAYSSERDIELVRDRVLKDIEKSLAQAQERYQEAAERHKQLSEEMQFYRKKPAPKDLLDAIKENESELRAHGSVVEAKTKEMEAVRAKYDEDKRRYIELIRGRSAGVDPRPR
jgi:phage-related tail protein